MAHHAPCLAEIKKLLDENKCLNDKNQRYLEALMEIKNCGIPVGSTGVVVDRYLGVVEIARRALEGEK